LRVRPFAADHLAHGFQLMRQHLVRRNDFIERIGDLPFDAISTGPHPDREVPCPHRLKRLEQVVQDRSTIQTVPLIGCRSFVLPRARSVSIDRVLR
jgi:hypothetical protein